MKKEEFIKAFMEGVEYSSGDSSTLVKSLLGQIYEERNKTKTYLQMIEDIDEVVAASPTCVQARCKACGNHYDIPCDISEFNGDFSYCGGSPRCCP